MAALSMVLDWDPNQLRLLGIFQNSEPQYNWLASFFPDDRGRDRLNTDRDASLFWSEQVCIDNSPCPTPPGCGLNVGCADDGGCRTGVSCDLDSNACLPASGCCETSFCGFTGFPFNDGSCLYEAWSAVFGEPANALPGAGFRVASFRFEVLAAGTSAVEIAAIGGPFTPTRVFSASQPDVNILGTIGPAVNVVAGTAGAPPTAALGSGRYLGVDVSSNPDSIALRVDGASPDTTCVAAKYANADGTLGNTPVFQTGAQWGTIYLHSDLIIPDATYTVRTDCGGGVSNPTSIDTYPFADVNDSGVVDLDDILLVLAGFSGNFSLASFEQLNLFPCDPGTQATGVIDLDDILLVLAVFSGAGYEASGCPLPCP
jgi:hypothetical protein